MTAQPDLLIARSSLRDDLRSRLVDWISSGALPVGSRIAIRDTALRLGVSPTPLREALSQLVYEGIVESRWAYGFFVASISEPEAREVYQLLGALEALAIRLTGRFDAPLLRKLAALEADLKDAASADQAAGLDRLWHASITGASGNALLSAKLGELRRRVSLIELKFMRDRARRPESDRQHARIRGLVKRGALDEAASAIEDHWAASVDFIVESKGR